MWDGEVSTFAAQNTGVIYSHEHLLLLRRNVLLKKTVNTAVSNGGMRQLLLRKHLLCRYVCPAAQVDVFLLLRLHDFGAAAAAAASLCVASP